MQNTPPQPCRSKTVDGRQCQSPAKPGKTLCHFHEVCGPVIDVNADDAAPSLLLSLTDADSIQQAIKQVCEHLLQCRIDSKKAGILLYAFQVASMNLDRLTPIAPPSATPVLTGPTASGHRNSPSSADHQRLPPGTIQACEQPRRRRTLV